MVSVANFIKNHKVVSGIAAGAIVLSIAGFALFHSKKLDNTELLHPQLLTAKVAVADSVQKPLEKINYEQLAEQYYVSGAFFEAAKAYHNAVLSDTFRKYNNSIKAAQSYLKAAEEYAKNEDFVSAIVLSKVAISVAMIANTYADDSTREKSNIYPGINIVTGARTFRSNYNPIFYEACSKSNQFIFKLEIINGLNLGAVAIGNVLALPLGTVLPIDVTTDSLLVRCALATIDIIIPRTRDRAKTELDPDFARYYSTCATELPKLAKIIIASVSDSTLKAQLTQELKQAGF